MNVPLSWLKDYLDIDLPIEEIARLLTMLGMEVEEVRVIGLPLPAGEKHEFRFTGLAWEPDKIVVAQIDEVMPHPNADRLTLCRLNDGGQELIVLTGAPNLWPYKGQGPLAKPLKVAYAKEGARLYDGHQPGQVLTTLKRTKIRGVESFSMVCSEKELGISEEHEGIILLDDDAPTGMPLVEYMGDAVFELSILPNMIRNACVLGVARELAALLDQPLRQPARRVMPEGPSVIGQVEIEISDPKLNPRFTLGMIRNVEPRPSPYWVQRRLRLAGMRPINSIVDATNYVMLEIGQPLHAFDYDVLVQRAGGKTPVIHTRPAHKGEKLTTLDGVERKLDAFTIMVTDRAGSLSLAGVMGGMESEVTDQTRNVLLEGATWNFINIRKTSTAQRLNSEAAYRFARGIHPALAPLSVELGLERMAEWGGGVISRDLVDNYPLPYKDPTVKVSADDVKRLLGITLTAEEIAGLLGRLGFECSLKGKAVLAKAPAHRTDIGEGVIGLADVMEEIARLYGYDRIPSTRLADELAPMHSNAKIEGEERTRDILVSLGLQEVVSYRLTSPEREARIQPDGRPLADAPYLFVQNPLAPERSAMRRSVLVSVLEALERNARLRDRLALFEVGPVFLPKAGQQLPDEPRRLALAISGLRHQTAWDQPESAVFNFFDLKGMIEALLDALHVPAVSYAPAGDAAAFHPGKCARVKSGEVVLGVFGELHPRVKEHFDFGAAPVLAAELDLEALLSVAEALFHSEPVAVHPPVLEDIAVVVDEDLPAARVVEIIQQAGGKLLRDVRLFDIFRGEQIGAGKKSLAYNLTYQAPDRTLNDKEAAQIRQKIIRRLEQELGAKLRS